MAEMGIKKYIEEVKSNKFPSEEYCYPITEEELNTINIWLKDENYYYRF